MAPDQLLVGSLAIALATLACATALRLWEAPLRLRSLAELERRFGVRGVQAVLLLVAAVMAASAWAIFFEARPPYAQPADPPSGGASDAASGSHPARLAE